MSLSRRGLVKAAAGAPLLAFLEALPAAAAGFDGARLTPMREAWAEIEHVNRDMRPTRLTGSPASRRARRLPRPQRDRV